MSTAIVTTGRVAGGLLRRLVEGHPRLRDQGLRIVVDEGRGGTASRASNIRNLHHVPVAVVADSDTLSPAVMADDRGLMEYIIGGLGPSRGQWYVQLISPEVAVLLFRDEQLLRSLLPVSPSFEQLIRGRYEPNRVLAELFAQAGEKPFPDVLLRRLEQADLSSLWSSVPELRPLEEFLLSKLLLNSRAPPLEPALRGSQGRPVPVVDSGINLPLTRCATVR